MNRAPVGLWIGGSKPRGFDGKVTRVEVLDTVITQQRMVAAAHVAPSVPFMPLLIGAKAASHVKFFSESDSDEDAPDDKDPRVPDDDPMTVRFTALFKDGEIDLNPSQLRAGAKFIAPRTWDPIREPLRRADEFPHIPSGPSVPLRGSLQLVQGPPGCGKTKFVATAIRAAVRDTSETRDPRILVCAPSNKAVTVVLRKYLDSGAGDKVPGCEDTSYPVLVGAEDALQLACTDDDGGDGDGTYGVMDYFVYRRTGVLADRLERASQRAGPAETGPSCSDLRVRLERCIKELERTAPSFLASAPLQNLPSLHSELRRALATCTIVNADAREDAVRNACEMLRTASGRGDKSDEYASEAVSRATLVFATLASSGQGIMANMPPPDALIVDEAAQALESEVLIAFARRPRRCLLVGDPAQLPATMASEVARRAGHDVSLMQRLLNIATRREIGGGRAGASRVVHASGHAVPDAPGHIEVSVGAILSRVRARRRRRVEPWFRVPIRLTHRWIPFRGSNRRSCSSTSRRGERRAGVISKAARCQRRESRELDRRIPSVTPPRLNSRRRSRRRCPERWRREVTWQPRRVMDTSAVPPVRSSRSTPSRSVASAPSSTTKTPSRTGL